MLSDQQLDTSIQRAMEDRMGDNLGDVRIHTGPSAAKACEDINARAFTVGNHIAFNHGEYDPSSAEGQHILAHELAHVRQQTGGAVSMLPQAGELEIDPDPRLEREAEETAQRVMQGGKIGVHRMEHSDVHVQRTPAEVSVENNYAGIRELKEEVSELKEKVNSGWSEKVAGGMAAVGSSAAVAGTRAALESDLAQTIEGGETLSKMIPQAGEIMAQHPEVTAAVALTTVASGGLYGAQQAVDGSGIFDRIGDGVKSAFGRVKSKFSRKDESEREEEAAKEDDSGLLSW
ncbi:DUF4157 domain-containing protein [Halogeometricum borinquense]|uniref:eCIS core domain-containing protein n=1 Tax=Halogeometricum borinquense TaxID=60847 RepID=UPI00344A7A6F